MVIAALCAEGRSTIGNIRQIDRGYERIDERLRARRRVDRARGALACAATVSQRERPDTRRHRNPVARRADRRARGRRTLRPRARDRGRTSPRPRSVPRERPSAARSPSCSRAARTGSAPSRPTRRSRRSRSRLGSTGSSHSNADLTRRRRPRHRSRRTVSRATRDGGRADAARAARRGRGHRPCPGGDLQGARRRARTGVPGRRRRRDGEDRDPHRSRTSAVPGRAVQPGDQGGELVFVAGQLGLKPGDTAHRGRRRSADRAGSPQPRRRSSRRRAASLDNLVKTSVFLHGSRRLRGDERGVRAFRRRPATGPLDVRSRSAARRVRWSRSRQSRTSADVDPA